MIVTYKSFEAGVLDWVQREFLSNLSGGAKFAMSAAVVSYIPVVRDWYTNNTNVLKSTGIVRNDNNIDTTTVANIMKDTFAMNDNCVRMHIPLIRIDVTIKPDDVTKILEYVERRGAGDVVQRDVSNEKS